MESQETALKGMILYMMFHQVSEERDDPAGQSSSATDSGMGHELSSGHCKFVISQTQVDQNLNFH